jgi:hypothetical protein
LICILTHNSKYNNTRKRIPFAHPSVMYRQQLIEQLVFYPSDSILLEDNVLWGRALLYGLRFANIPEYLFKFRIDRDFYKRRSGLKYGCNYIRTRIRLQQELKISVIACILIVFVDVIKMLPPGCVRIFYQYN